MNSDPNNLVEFFFNKNIFAMSYEYYLKKPEERLNRFLWHEFEDDDGDRVTASSHDSRYFGFQAMRIPFPFKRRF